MWSCLVLGRVYFWLSLRSPIRLGLQTVLRRLWDLLCAFMVHVVLSFLLALGEEKRRLLLTMGSREKA